MDFVSHRGNTPILLGRSAIQPICSFDVYLDGLKSPLFKKRLSDLNLYEAVKSPGLVAQLKLKRFLMKSNS